MNWPSQIPVMTIPGATLFPKTMVPLYIFEPRYRHMLADCLASHRLFALAMRRPAASREIPFKAAGIGLIRVALENADGTSHLILQGISRIKLLKAARYRPYRVHHYQRIESVAPENRSVGPLREQLLELVALRMRQGCSMPLYFLASLLSHEPECGSHPKVLSSGAEVLETIFGLKDSERLVDLISCTFLNSPAQRQEVLASVDLEERFERVIAHLKRHLGRGA